MQDERESTVLKTQEVCDYLRISRPTCLKYFYTGRIKATKAGKGWRVLKFRIGSVSTRRDEGKSLLRRPWSKKAEPSLTLP